MWRYVLGPRRAKFWLLSLLGCCQSQLTLEKGEKTVKQIVKECSLEGPEKRPFYGGNPFHKIQFLVVHRTAQSNSLYVKARPKPFLCTEKVRSGRPLFCTATKKGLNPITHPACPCNFCCVVTTFFTHNCPIQLKKNSSFMNERIISSFQNNFDTIHSENPRMYFGSYGV